MSRKSISIDGQPGANAGNDSGRTISLFGSEIRETLQPEAIDKTPNLSARFGNLKENWKRRLLYPIFGCGLCALLVIGVMGKNGWLPSTDSLSGKRTGWFGRDLPQNASSSWNPIAAPLPVATPQLSKEYIYAGSRMLAVEDAGASAAPPADLAVWRPSSGYWYVLGGPNSQQTFTQWGNSDDKPVPGDYDGDGKTDFAVWRKTTATWYFNYSSGSTGGFALGSVGGEPVSADFDGDGKSDPAVFHAPNGIWSIARSSAGVIYPQFGQTGDIPAPADYDGDGRADIAVYRPGNQTFYAVRSSDTTLLISQVGLTGGDKPVSGDYDGDGTADFAVRSGADWLIKQSSNNQTLTVNWGQAGDEAVQNDYDGDGKVDIAVWGPTNGYWYIRQSQSLTARAVQWGAVGDIPVPAFYRR